LAEHGENVLDLLGIDLFRQGVDLVMGDVAALLGGADEVLDGHVRKVKQWAVRRGLGTLLLRHLVLLRRHLGLACHASPQPGCARNRSRSCRVADSLKGRLRLLNTSSAADSLVFPGGSLRMVLLPRCWQGGRSALSR